MVSSLNQIEPAGDQDTHSELSRINILSEGGRYWAPKDEGQEQTVSTVDLPTNFIKTQYTFTLPPPQPSHLISI